MAIAGGIIGSFGGGGNLGTLFLRLTADPAQLIQGMNRAEASVLRSSAAIGSAVFKLGAVATTALAGIGAAAVREFSKFEDSFTGVRKTVDATEAEFSKLSNQFRELAKELPVNVNEINRVAEAAGQLGIKKENIVEFTKVMIDLGNTTNLASDQAATQLARLANITQMPQSEFGRLGSTVVALGNNLATTEAEIVEMALRLAGAGTTVGLAEHEILSMSAALSSLGVQAEAGGTAMSQAMIRMFETVKTGGKELELFAQVAGSSAQEFANEFSQSPVQAIGKFVIGLKQMQDQGMNVFGVLDQLGLDGIRMTDILLRMSNAGTIFADSLALGSKAWQQNSALTKEAQERYKTFSSQITITLNLIRDIAITIGGALAPHILQLNKMLQEALRNTDNFKGAIDLFVNNTIPLLLSGIGMIGDAIWGWRLILKGAEVWFETLASAVLKIFSKVEQIVTTVWETIINNIVNGINGVVRLANQVLPSKLEIPEIKFKLDIPESQLANWSEAVKQVRDESITDLDRLLARGSFSERLLKGYQSAANGIKKENEKIVEDVAKTVDAVKKVTIDPVKQASQQAMATLGGMEMPEMGFGRGRGMRGLEDPAVMQARQVHEELTVAQEKLRILEEINSQELTLTEEMQEKKIKLLEGYNEKVRQLQQAQAQIAFASSAQMFDDLAMIAETFGGRQSALFKTMFAASKAFAIAESIVKIQQGIANAASLPWPANLAAIASVVSATANIVSTISAVQLEFGGERAKGGPVSPGSAFLVGERGPELFVPSEAGDIVPNESLGGPMRVVVNNYTDARPEIRERDENGERVLEVMIRRVKNEIGSEIRDGRGEVTKALESTFKLGRGR